MPLRVLWGSDSKTDSGDASNASHQLAVASASLSGKATKIGFLTNTSGLLKANIYNSSSGVPSTLIWADDTGLTIAGTGWEEFDISPFDMSSSNEYAAGGIPNNFGAFTYDNGVSSNRSFNSATFATFTAPDPISGYTSGSWIYSYNVYIKGWVPNTINSIDNIVANSGLLNFTISGSDFMTDSDPATVYLSPTDNIDDTNRVECTITAQADDEISFDVPSSITNDTWYLFVKSYLGLSTANGFSVDFKYNTWAFVTNNDGDRSKPFHCYLIPGA